MGAFRPWSHEIALESRPLVALAPGSLGRVTVLMRRQPQQWLSNRSLSWHYEHCNEAVLGSRLDLAAWGSGFFGFEQVVTF